MTIETVRLEVMVEELGCTALRLKRDRDALLTAAQQAAMGFDHLRTMIEKGTAAEGEADRFTQHRMSGVYALVYANIAQEATALRAAIEAATNG